MTVGSARSSGLDLLTRRHVVGIIRGYEPEAAFQAADVACSEGLDVLEITLDSPGALGAIGQVAERLIGATIGVGTVTRPEQVDAAMEAGARFVVTPVFSEPVIARAVDCGLPVVSGAATPTEILAALEAGAALAKVFPAAQLGGPSYIRAVRAPLGDPPLIPTGGVTPDNAAEYLASGAVAVGAGSALFSADLGEVRDWEELRRRVALWREVVS